MNWRRFIADFEEERYFGIGFSLRPAGHSHKQKLAAAFAYAMVQPRMDANLWGMNRRKRRQRRNREAMAEPAAKRRKRRRAAAATKQRDLAEK